MKKKLRKWIIVGVVVFIVAAFIATYARPMVQKLWKVLPWTQKITILSKITKQKPPQVAKKVAEERQKMAKEEAKIVPVVVHKASRIDFEDALPAMGTVKGNVEVEMRFEVNGVLEQINFKEGDVVKKGDVIAVLIQKDAILKLEYSQSKLKTAQTQMLTAKKKLEIHQNLYQIGAIIKAKLEEVALEYENAKSQVVTAEKEVEFAKQELQKTYLESPIDGIMGTRDVEVGEFITSNTKIATVIDISSVLAEVGVIEKDLQKIALSQQAEVVIDAFPETKFNGRIENILPVIEGKSRTITCKIKVDNSQGQFLPGMFARANIHVFSQKDAIVVPNACLRDQNEDGIFDSTFIVDEENVAHLAEIGVGYLTSDYAVISWGVEEGQLVVTEARGELTDGSIVELLETQEAFKPTEEEKGEKEEEEEELILH